MGLYRICTGNIMKKILLIVLLALALCSPSYAAFPNTGILDNFNRSNEGPPPSSNWEDSADPDCLAVVSNRAASTNAGADDDYAWNKWDGGTYGPNAEVYFTIVTRPALNKGFLVSMVDSTTGDGYGFDLFNTGASEVSITIYRIDEWAYTTLGSVITGADVDAGDKIGLQKNGSNVIVYKDIGAGWVEVGSRTDSAHSYSTYSLVLENYDGSFDLVIDDFGGGTITINNNFLMFL